MRIQLTATSARHPAAKAGVPDALKNVTLSVASGEQVAVIGPSGAGKTTLLHLLACALRPSTGQMLLDGKDPWALSVSSLQQLRGQLFLAPQVPPLPPRQRVVTAVLAGRLPQQSLWASLRSLFYPSNLPAAHNALLRFDLSEKLFERVDRLSGGERQRVGLSRILASSARLLLVDEPLSALDPSRSEQAMATLTSIASERGATLVATLHHVEMALKTFPRIIGMRDGEIAFDLRAKDVTSELLHDLYAQNLEELTGAAVTVQDAIAVTPAPVVMHCR